MINFFDFFYALLLCLAQNVYGRITCTLTLHVMRAVVGALLVVVVVEE